METPIVFEGGAVDPFHGLHSEERSTRQEVFYATLRKPKAVSGEVRYGNGFDSAVHLGTSVVRFGGEDIDWRQLERASLVGRRERDIELTLDRTQSLGRIEGLGTEDSAEVPTEFLDQINRQLARTPGRDLLVYVHGTKVDFLNACALVAEVDHFCGRELVSLAFSWPCHQNILSYLDRVDVRRAQHSSPALTRLIKMLADHSDARSIHILSYSAGCRVVSKALDELRNSEPDLTADQLRRRYRLGTAIFAAGDVPVRVFDRRLVSISELCDQVIITLSDGDNALQGATRLMGGGERAGSTAAEIEELATLRNQNLDNVALVDVSSGKRERGFDITGHHYWYRHPWVSSDIIMALRSGNLPEQRGLNQLFDSEKVWSFPKDYPKQVRELARDLFHPH